MPTDDGLRLHDDKDVCPTGPDLAQSCSEEPIEGVQRWPRAFPLKNCNVRSEREKLKRGVATAVEKHAECAQDGEDEFDHEMTFVT